MPLFILGVPFDDERMAQCNWRMCLCKSDIRFNVVGQTEKFKMVGPICWPYL